MTIRELGEKLKRIVRYRSVVEDAHEFCCQIDALIAVAEAADAGSATYAQTGALRAALEEEHEHEWFIHAAETRVAFCMNCPARVELPRRGKVGA